MSDFIFDWDLLKTNQCPQCKKPLYPGLVRDVMRMRIRHKCGFTMSEEKMRRVIGERVGAGLAKVEDNSLDVGE